MDESRMAEIIQVSDKQEFDISKIGDVEANIKIGGLDSTTDWKFAPNLNVSWSCFSWAEKYFLNLNRKSVLSGVATTIDAKLALVNDNDADIWHIDKNGHLKWDIKFDCLPKSFVIDWELLCSSGINFYYQPALTAIEILEGHIRPENVVGSYAVYCEKRNNRPGEKYFTGKLGHIYRPLCIDANGKTAWADLFIDKTSRLLRITLPQKFMAEAKYPVTLDPDLGYTTEGASTFGTQYYKIGCHDTSDGSGGDTAQIHIAIAAGANGSRNLTAAIYTDDTGNNRPENQLTAEVTITPGNGVTGFVTGNYVATLAASTKYWLAYSESSTSLTIKYDAENDNRMHRVASGTDITLPDNWGDTGSNYNYRISIYADYASAGGDTYYQNVGGYTLTPTGTIIKAISKTVGGYTLPLSGVLTDIYTGVRSVGGYTLTPTGVVTKVQTFLESVGGYTLTPTGSIVKKISKTVGGYTMSIVGTLSKTLNGGAIGAGFMARRAFRSIKMFFNS